jgi:hypothetical protein
MSIMLGNLTVKQIENRLGIGFPEDIREFMILNHEPNASRTPINKWHCFDIPFILVCGNIDTATKIFDSVKNRSGECKEILRISVNG